jgi:exonuclease SbcD|tara:strand:+ start:316 stop:1566 length:1251 start_codon:yes stop_codon:yes gene_type:complete
LKFAHLADTHLGRQRNKKLVEIEKRVFQNTIEQILDKDVDFVLIAGDFFDVNIPNMEIQKLAFEQFKKIKDRDIPIYVIYGSHDFSPNATSVIDLLNSGGFFTKIPTEVKNENGKIKLKFFVDPKTGVKITGLSGLKASRDTTWYEQLDRNSLESKEGFKIFMFHGGINEMIKENMPEADFMPLSYLPKNFDYYAGGHMHKFSDESFPNYNHVVYSGTLFSGFHSDLTDNANGQKRGFVLVEFEEKIESVDFIEVPNINYALIDVNAKNKKSGSVDVELRSKIKELEIKNKIVIINVKGELSEGKTTDIDFSEIKDELVKKEALSVLINRKQFSSREYNITSAKGANKEEIETNVFHENIGQMAIHEKKLLGKDGVSIAKSLLKKIGQPKLDNEKEKEYENRIDLEVFELLGIDVE